jgi:hypothetical protein
MSRTYTLRATLTLLALSAVLSTGCAGQASSARAISTPVALLDRPGDDTEEVPASSDSAQPKAKARSNDRYDRDRLRGSR